MVNLVGIFTFFAVLFAYLGIRSNRKQKLISLRASIDGNFTVDTEGQGQKRPFKMPFLSSLYVDFKKAGFRLGFTEFALIVVITVIAGNFLFSFLISSVYGMFGSLLALVVFKLWVRGRIKKRTLLLRGQFANALIRMANAMKAQVPLEETVRLIAEKIPDPLQSELKRVYQYYLAERSIIKALKMVQDQIPLEEFHLFIMSVEIQREVGGNLAELMEKLAMTIGDKQEMDKKLQVYSTQGKNNATTIAVLPILAFLFFRMVVPEFIAPMLTTTMGQFILFYCFLSIGFGWWLVRRMCDVTLD